MLKGMNFRPGKIFLLPVVGRKPVSEKVRTQDLGASVLYFVVAAPRMDSRTIIRMLSVASSTRCCY